MACCSVEKATDSLDAYCKLPISDDLTEWMTSLPAHVTSLPFNQISIPGSHDSGAFWLDSSSPVCPDESSTIKNLCKVFGSCAKKIVINWSITQALHITDQLNHGIRYFDMRNGYLQAEDDVFFVHGVYGHRISELLEAVNTFLSDHPKEVVILDFNHFYSFTTSLHQKFAKSIKSAFGDKLLPPNGFSVQSTLDEIWKAKQQVIVAYDDVMTCRQYTEFWPPDSIFSPWPNTDSVSKLVASLEQRFDSLKPKCFNIFQAILTPQTSTIVKSPFSSLKKKLSSKCDAAVVSWLTQVYTSKQLGVNIVICDFISLDSCASHIVILNQLHSEKEK